MIRVLLVAAAVAGAAAPSGPAEPREESAVGNREFTLALGYGVPWAGTFFVNPFGYTLEPRFRWAFGWPEVEFLVGGAGRFTASPSRSYFGGTVSPSSFGFGPEVGLRVNLPGQALYLGLDLGLSLGMLTYGASGGESCLCIAGGPVLGYRLSEQLSVAAEARTTWFTGSTLPDARTPFIAVTPALQGTFRF